MTLLTPSLSKKRNVENILDTDQQLQKCSLPHWNFRNVNFNCDFAKLVLPPLSIAHHYQGRS